MTEVHAFEPNGSRLAALAVKRRAYVRPFRVTWVADGYTVAAGGGRHQLFGWLRAHGIDRANLQVGVYVASHPLLGEVLIHSGPQRDARGRHVLAFGSTTEYAERVHVQPLGMPPPSILRERGEARAAELGLRLPVAALLSGGGKRG